MLPHISLPASWILDALGWGIRVQYSRTLLYDCPLESVFWEEVSVSTAYTEATNRPSWR